jgi:prevent-host-death family protein
MAEQHVGVAEFRRDCLKLIEQVAATGTPVVVTKRGRPVARLVAAPPVRPSVVGAMHGTVLRYEEPFEAAEDPQAWHAA